MNKFVFLVKMFRMTYRRIRAERLLKEARELLATEKEENAILKLKRQRINSERA